MVRACFLSVLYPALPAGHHAERLGNVGVHACFKHLFAVPLKAISIFGDIITERRVNFRILVSCPPNSRPHIVCSLAACTIRVVY